jgi:2-polyprenyl-3-methyl-5-hydroxy-6-metoxy-1,4-benzoquinol methylase
MEPLKRMRTCPFCASERIFIKYNTSSVYSCKSCKLWFRNPLPIEEELDLRYDKDYSDENIRRGTTHQAGTTILLAERYIKNLQRELRLDFANIRALEFGAGLGSISMVLRNKGAEVIAVEKNESAQKFIRTKGINVLGNIDTFPAELFDLLICTEVVEHLREPWLILNQLYHLLKPGGFLYLSTLNREGLNALITRGKWREILKPTHLYFFNAVSLKKILYSSGFTEIKRCKWLLNLNKHHSRITIRTIIQYFLQILLLDGALRYIVKKSKHENSPGT